MRQPSARELIGKRIVGFTTDPKPDGRGGTCHDPAIRLDDGTSLRFYVEETDLGEYGVGVNVIRIGGKARRNRKPTP